jgi:hypothetical protein
LFHLITVVLVKIRGLVHVQCLEIIFVMRIASNEAAFKLLLLRVHRIILRINQVTWFSSVFDIAGIVRANVDMNGVVFLLELLPVAIRVIANFVGLELLLILGLPGLFARVSRLPNRATTQVSAHLVPELRRNVLDGILFLHGRVVAPKSKRILHHSNKLIKLLIHSLTHSLVIYRLGPLSPHWRILDLANVDVRLIICTVHLLQVLV